MTVKNGRMFAVQNKNRKFGAVNKYVFVHLEDGEGNDKPYLFTPKQLRTARKRAEETPEDLAEKGLLVDWLD